MRPIALRISGTRYDDSRQHAASDSTIIDHIAVQHCNAVYDHQHCVRW